MRVAISSHESDDGTPVYSFKVIQGEYYKGPTVNVPDVIFQFWGLTQSMFAELQKQLKAQHDSMTIVGSWYLDCPGSTYFTMSHFSEPWEITVGKYSGKVSLWDTRPSTSPRPVRAEGEIPVSSDKEMMESAIAWYGALDLSK